MTNRSDMVSSGWNLNNHRMEKTPMHRAVKTAVVALAALAVGACAGRQLHVAVVPEQALAQPEQLPAILPSRPLTFQELLVPDVAQAREPEPTPAPPACDLAAEALKQDPELDTV